MLRFAPSVPTHLDWRTHHLGAQPRDDSSGQVIVEQDQAGLPAGYEEPIF